MTGLGVGDAFLLAALGRLRKQATVMEIEGGHSGRSGTDEPFTAECVAMLYGSSDAEEGAIRLMKGLD
jgi:hypothetical protein